MGSSNPLKKAQNAAQDAVDSIAKDPLSLVTKYATAGGLAGGMGLSAQGTADIGSRVRQDQRDQANGMAQKEQDAAAAAEVRAVDASVKEADPLALERRRRATLAGGKGRDGSILTGGTSLGAADVARKTLLGM